MSLACGAHKAKGEYRLRLKIQSRRLQIRLHRLLPLLLLLLQSDPMALLWRRPTPSASCTKSSA